MAFEYSELKSYSGNMSYFVQSYPMRVWWDGWESTTAHLQKEGWQIAAEQDILSQRLRLCIKNSKHKIYGISDLIQLNYLHNNLDYLRNIVLPIRNMASEMRIELLERDFSFKPIDAEPKFMVRKNIEDFAIFAPALATTNEIFIPEDTVSSLLDKILALQDPMMKEYYKNEVKRKKIEESMNIDAIPQRKFVAQVITLENYRKAA